MTNPKISAPEALFDSLDQRDKDRWTYALDNLATDSAQSERTGLMILAFIEDMNDLVGEEYEFDDIMSIEYSNVDAIQGWLNEEEYRYFENCGLEHNETSIEVYLMVKDPESGSYKFTWSYYEDFAPEEEDEDEDEDL